MNEYRHYRGRGRGNYQHGNNYRNQLGNNIYGSDVRRCNPNHFNNTLLPFPPFRETRPRWQRPPQHNNWRGTPQPQPQPPPALRHFSYVRTYSPTNVQKQQTRPLSPLPGSEEARQKAIAEASARIKQQLNLGDVHYDECNNMDTDDTQNNISDDCIILNELPIPNMLVNNKTPQDHKKRKHRKSVNNTTTTIEELRKKILTQFTYMSKGKIQNLVNNPGSTRYDNALQHLVRDMRLHLSSELRNMYTNRDSDPTNEHNKMIDHFNSIVPDLGIELVSLPDTMVAELSKILQLDVNNEIEEETHSNETNETNENVLVEPEDMFKQAEKLLSSTDFLNVSFDSMNPQNDENQPEVDVEVEVCAPLVRVNDPFVHRSPIYNCPPPNINTTPTCTIISQPNHIHEYQHQQNIRFDEDSIIYDNNIFYSQQFTNEQENISNLSSFSEAVVSVPVVPTVSLIESTENINKSTINLDVIPLPEIEEENEELQQQTNNENVEKNDALNLNIPLPEEPEIPKKLDEPEIPKELVEPEEHEELEEPINATIKLVDELRERDNTPVRDDSSPFLKKIQQDPIYEDAFKINVSSVNSLNSTEQQINNSNSNKSECALKTSKYKNTKFLFNLDSVWVPIQTNTNTNTNTKTKTKTKTKIKTKTSKTDTSNNKLNVTSFLQDVITNNLLDLPKDKPDKQQCEQNDFIDKRNKFICETSCESSKSLTDRNDESDVRPFSRTRSHSPYDLNQYSPDKMTKNRLSLDERIKEMMKIQETRGKPKEQSPSPSPSPSPLPRSVEEKVYILKNRKKRERKLMHMKRRKQFEKQKRIEREKEKQKEIERIKQIEREKQKKIEINALKELLKRQQQELEKTSNIVKLSKRENETNKISVQNVEPIIDKTPIVQDLDDASSITSNLLNLNSVTCNLKKSVVSVTSKIPIKLLSKTKSKIVKTEPDTLASINTIQIKDEPISEEESSSSSSENETETSADNLSEKTKIIHNLTKDILIPPKNTKNIRHFESIDSNLNITNKILERPVKNFKIIVETNPVSISPNLVNTTITQDEESQKDSEDVVTNLELTIKNVNPDKETICEGIVEPENNLISQENSSALIEENVALNKNNNTLNENNDALIEENVLNQNEEILLEPVNEETNNREDNIINENKCNEENIKETTVVVDLIENKIETPTTTTTKDKCEEENKSSDKKHNENNNNNSKTSDKKQSDNKKSEVSSNHKKTSSSSSSKKIDDSKKHRHGSVDRKKEESSKTSKLHRKTDSKHKTSDSKTSSSSHYHHHHHQQHHHSDHQSSSSSSSSGKQKIINRLLDIDLQIQKLMQEKWNLYKDLNITNIEQLPNDGDTNITDLLLNKSKHSKMPRLSPETKTKETTTPEINVKHISTQTDLIIIENVENTQQKAFSDVDLNDSTPKKNKHRETKKTSSIKNDGKNDGKNKRKEVDSKKNLRKRKLSESESSIASSNIQESINIEQVVVSDSEIKKQKQPKTKYNKTRQTRNSLNKIDKIDVPVVIDEKCSETNDETKNKNVIPKLKISLVNVKSKTTKHVQSKDESDEIITKPNNQSENKMEGEDDTINKITTKGGNKKIRNKKVLENEVVIPPTITTPTPTAIINSVESKEETVLVINTRKRTAKSKKSFNKELIVDLPEDKSISTDKKEDIKNSELEDKHEEINDNTMQYDEEVQNTKRKSKKEKTKVDEETYVEISKKNVNDKKAIRKTCERRNSRNRSATPVSSSSSSSIIENKIETTLELKAEAITAAKRSRKRKMNTEINDTESKKSKITKAEPEITAVSSHSNKINNSDEEVEENLLGFNVDNSKEDLLAKAPLVLLPNPNDTILETPDIFVEEICDSCVESASESVLVAVTDNIIEKNDIEVEQKRKQIRHNRKLNKIVTDNASTDSIDNIYIDDAVNVTSYDKLVKSCFVQLERINIKLNEEIINNEEEHIIRDDDLVDSALISDENLNDILLAEIGNEEIDFNILSDDNKCDEQLLDKLIESPIKELDVIDENGMFCMGHQKSILDIKIVGDEFFAASEDGTIYKYCLKSGTLQDAYTGHKRAVTCIYTTSGTFLNIDSTLLYSGSLDCTLKCYNIETAEVVHSVTVAQAIQCLDSAWGYIFLGTYEGLLFIYNMKKKILNEHSLTIANATVLMIKATQEGSRQVLILASRKREIMVRDAFTGLLLRTMCEEQKPTIYSLLLDRSMVYCGTSDKGILILDFNNGQQVGAYNSGKGVVCMLMYRSLLFAGCYDGLIYVYNTKTQKHVTTISGPGEGMLLSLAICNDVIIAGSKKDHLLKIWKIPQEIFNQIGD